MNTLFSLNPPSFFNLTNHALLQQKKTTFSTTLKKNLQLHNQKIKPLKPKQTCTSLKGDLPTHLTLSPPSNSCPNTPLSISPPHNPPPYPPTRKTPPNPRRQRRSRLGAPLRRVRLVRTLRRDVRISLHGDWRTGVERLWESELLFHLQLCLCLDASGGGSFGGGVRAAALEGFRSFELGW